MLDLGSGGSQANLSETFGNDVIETTRVGQSIGEFYGYIFDGVFSKPSDFVTHAGQLIRVASLIRFLRQAVVSGTAIVCSKT